MKLEKYIRRRFPSAASLTYRRPVKAALDLFDVPPRLWFREFKRLPPNHLRVRIGVGNRFFANQVQHLTRGEGMWLWLFSQGLCTLDSDIVEIGCGCGRRTQHMRDFKFRDATYTGSYLGIDIDAEMIDWCRRNFDSRFEFVVSTHASKTYKGGTGAYYEMPRQAGSVDLVFGTSLLTHLLEPELENYVKDAARVLRDDGALLFSVFCMDYLPPTYGNRHTFAHRIGNAYVESMASPEAAVAYTEEYLFGQAKQAGFREMRILHHEKSIQSMLVCRK